MTLTKHVAVCSSIAQTCFSWSAIGQSSFGTTFAALYCKIPPRGKALKEINQNELKHCVCLQHHVIIVVMVVVITWK